MLTLQLYKRSFFFFLEWRVAVSAYLLCGFNS